MVNAHIETSEHRRRSIRLRDYDYSKEGGYFVTLCTENRELWLDIAEIKNVARRQWIWLTEQYRCVEVDAFVIMPNHIHGILVLCDDGEGGSRTAPMKRKSLGRLVGAFKTTSAKAIHHAGYHAFAWQRNYYERVVRDEKELARIREYIAGNPLQWASDRENPESMNYNMDYETYMDGIYVGGPRSQS